MLAKQLSRLSRKECSNEMENFVEINVDSGDDEEALVKVAIWANRHGYSVTGFAVQEPQVPEAPIHSSVSESSTSRQEADVNASTVPSFVNEEGASTVPSSANTNKCFVYIDGCSSVDEVNNIALDGGLSGFTVSEQDIKDNRPFIRKALRRNLLPIFRFPTRYDHNLSRRHHDRLLCMAKTARKQFERKFKTPLKHVLLPFTSDYSKRFKKAFTRAGFKLIYSDIHFDSRTLQHLDNRNGRNRVLCWNIKEESSISAVENVLDRFSGTLTISHHKKKSSRSLRHRNLRDRVIGGDSLHLLMHLLGA
jgi:hypothetical protein